MIAVTRPAPAPLFITVRNQSGNLSWTAGTPTAGTPTATDTAITAGSWSPPRSTPAGVRGPLAATVPDITGPAPPRTGAGAAVTTAPGAGGRPSGTRMPPAVATARRLRARGAARPVCRAAAGPWGVRASRASA